MFRSSGQPLLYTTFMRKVTLCFLMKDNEILLAMKKRGFGEGKWNGVGGKVEKGESLVDAAVRELQEEIAVHTEPHHLEEVADIEFLFDGQPDWNQHMHVFVARTWKGEPQESDEMAPQWYVHADIPYESMWVDDPHWLPRVLAGERLTGSCRFTADGAEILDMDLRVRI